MVKKASFLERLFGGRKKQQKDGGATAQAPQRGQAPGQEPRIKGEPPSRVTPANRIQGQVGNQEPAARPVSPVARASETVRTQKTGAQPTASAKSAGATPAAEKPTQKPGVQKPGVQNGGGAKPAQAQAAAQKPAQQNPAATKPAAPAAKPGSVEKRVVPSSKVGNGGVKPAAKASERSVDAPTETETGSGMLSRVLGNRREEAAQALAEGFRDLSTLLRGIHDRMDEQGSRADNLSQKFDELPAMAKAQVEFMRNISDQMVKQKEKTSELLNRLGGLPSLLEGIHKTLEKQVANEERTEKTLSEFRSTMNRIHDSIGTLSAEGQKAMQASTENLERVHRRATRVFEENQAKAYSTFEKNQEAHLAQIATLMERSGKMNRSIVVLLVLVFAALVTLFGFVLGS